jgi:hypothetical protein
MCCCTVGRIIPDVSKDFSTLIFSVQRYVALKMKALRPFGTSSTTGPTIQPHKLEDLDLHMKCVFFTCYMSFQVNTAVSTNVVWWIGTNPAEEPTVSTICHECGESRFRLQVDTCLSEASYPIRL